MEKWDKKEFKTFLKKYQSKVLKKERKGTEKTNWQNIPENIWYTAERFDPGKYWFDIDGGGKLEHLKGLAVIHLSNQYSNAFVERVFSGGSWVDTARSQRIADSTFEKRVLDRQNRETIAEALNYLQRQDCT